MKKNLMLILIFISLSTSAFCQSGKPSGTNTTYAMLHIVGDQQIFEIEYSNAAGKVNLLDKIKIDTDKESLTQAKYKCFSYLNNQGYELVTSNSFSIELSRSDFAVKYEYVFKLK